MRGERPAKTVLCTREHIREAAVWLTLLRGPGHTARLEESFNRWLKAAPGHTAAFEKISTAWEATAALPRGPFPHLTRWQRAGFRLGFLRASATVAMAVVFAVIGLIYYQANAGISTAVGEQRILELEDGTKVYLNTDSRIVVKYDRSQRAVDLKSGEALFEVAKHPPDWPFVVRIAGRSVTAFGTSFVVKRDNKRVSVTLVEGRVAVSSIEDGRNALLPRVSQMPAQVQVLAPGQRVTYDERQTARVDEPNIDGITAWRTGHVDLDNVPLIDAVMEMNRYSTTKLIVASPEAAAIPITGIFRAGDSTSFANAVAESYGLERVQQGSDILLRVMSSGLPDHRGSIVPIEPAKTSK